ncbi:ATP-binding protein [Marinoscillum sp.]|uniref:PAS domain-containing sensor histidine kinase n=1 Tax=Marinoscillum sp. TaxID=2024838 RepID=UPI003BA9B94A
MPISNEYLTSSNGLQLLNKIFLGAGEGIIIVDSEGKIRLINKRAEEIFEYEQNELIGRVIEDLIPQKYHKQHVPHRTKYIAHPVTRPMGIGRHLTGQRKSGSEFPVEVSLSYVMHEDEKLVVAFISDITRRKEQEDALKQSEEKLKQYTSELESKVQERTQELEHLNLGLKSQIRERKLAEAALQSSLEELKKAEKEILNALEKEKELNEMKSRFISMASHEFRTPLTTIHTSANLVAKYTEAEQQTNRDKHVNRIKSAVNNLTNILNDFLSLEKLESGAITMKVEPFKMTSLFREVEEVFEQGLKKDQQLKITIEEDITEVVSDPHILKNIIINLISNAIKYSDEGKTITATTSRVNDHIQIAIKDEGIGIPLDEQKNLFQRFFRADNASNIQGTGLGLNIVKRYLDLINGNITFTSKENQGSEFVISFPIKP